MSTDVHIERLVVDEREEPTPMDQWRTGVVFNLVMMQAEAIWERNRARERDRPIDEFNHAVAERAVDLVAERFGMFRLSTEAKLQEVKSSLVVQVVALLPAD